MQDYTMAYINYNSMAYWLKTRIVNTVETAVARERLCKRPLLGSGT
jgi:hypothetical protein